MNDIKKVIDSEHNRKLLRSMTLEDISELLKAIRAVKAIGGQNERV